MRPGAVIRTVLLGLAILANPSLSSSADMLRVLSPNGTAAVGELQDADESRLFSFDGSSLDYFKGRLDADVGRFDLDLISRDGVHLRRLLDNAGGGNDFQFVLEEEDVLLRITARTTSAHYALSLTSRVTPGEQRPVAQSYLSPRIEALAGELAAGASTDAFWQDVAEKGTPLVEPAEGGHYIATFLWRGAQHNVRLFGAPSGNHENLDRLGGSDVWYKSFLVPAETRLSYQLAPDVPDLPGNARERRVAILSTAQEDPLNKHPWPADGLDRFNRDSVLELPKAPAEPYLGEQGHPKGKLRTLSVKSEALGNEREITIYTPAGYNPADANLLFLFDAKQMLREIPMPEILDNMIGAGVIGPTVAVMVANPDADARGRELPANPVFAEFMAKQLLPLVLKETGLKHDPHRTALGGASYGGLASMTIALRYPELFGNVLSMSGSFWWSPPGTPADRQDYVAHLVAEGPEPAIRIFMSAGLFEGDASKGVGSILDTNRHLRDVLLAKNNHATYREYAGGHDFLIWRSIVIDGLISLFGK
jgi:enterochelin esterase-like enzyme